MLLSFKFVDVDLEEFFADMFVLAFEDGFVDAGSAFFVGGVFL